MTLIKWFLITIGLAVLIVLAGCAVLAGQDQGFEAQSAGTAIGLVLGLVVGLVAIRKIGLGNFLLCAIAFAVLVLLAVARL